MESADVNEFYKKARSFEVDGNYGYALIWYNKILYLNEKYADAWYRKGIVLSNLYNLDKFQSKNKRSSTRDLSYLFDSSNSSKETRDGITEKMYFEVIECFEESIRIDTNNSDSWYSRGIVLCDYCKNCSNCKELERLADYEFLNRMQEAMGSFRRAEYLDSKNVYHLAFQRYVEPTLFHRLRNYDNLLNQRQDKRSYILFQQASIFELLGDKENASIYRQKANEEEVFDSI